MIRVARPADAPEIEAMIREMHQRSKYAGRADVSDKALSAQVASAIAMQGQNGPQASMAAIACTDDGKPVGMIIGVLDRIYGILNKLEARDAYFYVRPRNSVRHSLGLIDAYVKWASGNPKVLEIIASSNDALPGREGVNALLKRKGFEHIGEVFVIRADRLEEMAA